MLVVRFSRAIVKGQIALGTIRTSFVLSLRLLIQAGTLLLVARLLGPEEFGAFAGIASLAILLGTFSTFGTNLVLLGEVSKDPRRRDDVLSYAMPTTLLCGSLLLFVYLALAHWVLASSVIPWPTVLAIGVAEVMLQPLFVLPVNEHLALGRTARSQLLVNIPLALRMFAAGIVLLCQFEQPLSVYSYGYLSASILALLVVSATMSEPWPGIRRWRFPKAIELKRNVSYAALAISYSAPSELDKTLAVKLLPVSESGLYAAASRVIGAATLPLSAMMLTVLPRLFYLNEKPNGGSRRIVCWVYGGTAIYSVLLSIVLWHISSFVEAAFGEGYEGVAGVVSVLALATPGIALRLTGTTYIMSLDKPWMRVVFETFLTITMLFLSICFVEYYGVYSIVYAVMISEYLFAAVILVFVVKSFKSEKTNSSV